MAASKLGPQTDLTQSDHALCEAAAYLALMYWKTAVPLSPKFWPGGAEGRFATAAQASVRKGPITKAACQPVHSSENLCSLPVQRGGWLTIRRICSKPRGPKGAGIYQNVMRSRRLPHFFYGRRRLLSYIFEKDQNWTSRALKFNYCDKKSS